MLFGIYQAILKNFGTDLYLGDSIFDAMDAAKKSGFEAILQLDGSLVAEFSPISGWKFFY